VTELNLDNCRATAISGFSDQWTNLEALSLINVGLTTLKGFPNLPALKRLELSDNRIAANLEYLQSAPNMTHLNLSGNKIANADTLEPLKELKHLVSLDLFNCDVTTSENYRENVFKTLEQLKYLDGYDVNDEEADSEDEEGVGEDVDEGDDSEEDDEDGDGSEVGLEYLQSSRVIQDEDETEDFAPEDEDTGDGHEAEQRGTKRKHDQEDHEDEDDDEN